MERFVFKPAMFRGPTTYMVGPRTLECREADGAVSRQLDWVDVRKAAFVEHSAHGAHLRRLDMMTGAGRRSVSCTGPDDPSTDTDAIAHLGLVAAILDRLEQDDGGFDVTLGEFGKARLAMFFIGVLSALGSVGIAAAGLLSGLPSGRLTEAALPILLLFAFGAILALGNAPWRRPPEIRAALLARVLRDAVRPGPRPGKHEGQARTR